MKLWLLERNSLRVNDDEASGFVVRAEDETQARFFAGPQAGDEGESTWADERKSTCVELTAAGVSGVVLRDFNYG